MQAVYIYMSGNVLTFFFAFSRDFGDRLYFHPGRGAEPWWRAAALGPVTTARLSAVVLCVPRMRLPPPRPRLPGPGVWRSCPPDRSLKSGVRTLRAPREKRELEAPSQLRGAGLGVLGRSRGALSVRLGLPQLPWGHFLFGAMSRSSQLACGFLSEVTALCVLYTQCVPGRVTVQGSPTSPGCGTPESEAVCLLYPSLPSPTCWLASSVHFEIWLLMGGVFLSICFLSNQSLLYSHGPSSLFILGNLTILIIFFNWSVF